MLWVGNRAFAQRLGVRDLGFCHFMLAVAMQDLALRLQDFCVRGVSQGLNRQISDTQTKV